MSSMNPFHTAAHLASLWGKSGDTLLDAQRSLVQELAGWMPSVAPEPATPNDGYEAAHRAFVRSWETALEVSRAATANLSESGDPALAATLHHLLDPAAWFARGSGQEPGPGDIAATTSLFEAVTLVRRRDLEHDVVRVEAWMQAAGAFARALHGAAGQGVAPETPERVTALWSEHADPVFAEVDRSDAMRRARDRLAVARAELEIAQRAVGQLYGYASQRDFDALRETVEGLRGRFDEVLARREPDAPTAARPSRLPQDDTARTAEPEERVAGVEPPPRYVVRSHGREGPAVLLVGVPDDPGVREVADSLARHDVAAREVVWSQAAWRGSLDDLARDLAHALDDLARDLAPIACLGVGWGAIPLVCLAARRPLPALIAVEAAFAFDLTDPNMQDPNMHDPDMHDPDWLATVRRDDSAMRGTLAVDGEPVDLAAITCPVLNLVPDGADTAKEAARALAHLVASDDYAERPLPSPGEAGAAVAGWLDDRRRFESRSGRLDIVGSQTPDHEVS